MFENFNIHNICILILCSQVDQIPKHEIHLRTSGRSVGRKQLVDDSAGN